MAPPLFTKLDPSTSGAKAHIHFKGLIVALKRCATQNRTFRKLLKRCATQNRSFCKLFRTFRKLLRTAR